MKPKRRKPTKRQSKHQIKMLGAAAINSHLEAIRVALIVYDMDWIKDGFEKHWQQQLTRVVR